MSYQTRENITAILEPLFEFRRGQNQYRPILLKVSPDLSDETIDLMTDIMIDTPLDGMVAVNATLSREGIDRLEATRLGAGVVSGRPLTQRALEVVRRIHTRSRGTYPIIGVGGLMTPADVRAHARRGSFAGADLHGVRLQRSGLRARHLPFAHRAESRRAITCRTAPDGRRFRQRRAPPAA